MKKLLLLLLCVPLLFSCGEKEEEKDNDTKEIIENNCDVNPDYIMTAEDFIRTIENEKNNKKYDGKVFQVSLDRRDKNFSMRSGNYTSLSFRTGTDKPGGKTGKLDFDFDKWSDVEDEYYEKMSDASKKKGYQGSTLTIKGTYLYKESELERKDFNFINCCLVIPNKNNNNTSSKKIDNNKEEIEEEIYGVINDPDGYTNVREDKSSKSEIVFKVYKNKRFKIIDNSGNWWLIEYNGEQGYMYKNRIDVIK